MLQMFAFQKFQKYRNIFFHREAKQQLAMEKDLVKKVTNNNNSHTISSSQLDTQHSTQYKYNTMIQKKRQRQNDAVLS